MKDIRKKPAFSVIIPTFNRSGVLQEALGSVIAQEGAGDLFEMEIVVVDDASSDNTPEVIKKYPDIHYIRLEKNLGQSAAANIGIRASRGEYIALLDDDDLWLPNRLKAHLPAFENNPQVGVVYGQIIATGDETEKIWPDVKRAPSGDVFSACLSEEIVGTMCIAIRRSAFEKVGYFDEKLRTMSHYDMFLRLAFHVPFEFVPGPIAIGRFSEDAKWFSNVKKGIYVKNTLFIIERVLKEIPDPVRRTALRRQAYISWLGQFNYWLKRAGEIDQICNLLLSIIKSEPWLFGDPKGLQYIRTSLLIVVRSIAFKSDFPISDVRTFCRKFKNGIGENIRRGKWPKLAQLQAAVWMAAGIVLTESDSVLKRRRAFWAAFYAILYNPALIIKPGILKIIIRSVIREPNYARLTIALKAIF